jgi:transposase-like protein
MKTFKSILEFQRHFSTDDKCREFLEEQRWNGTPVCPFCGSTNVCRFTDGKLFKCRVKDCRKKFTVTVGTIYQSSKLPLTVWFVATYVLTVHSKGISSLQLASFLGITQKSAWHLTHRIRQMLTDKDPVALSNMVEADECYIGGLNKNRHASKKKKNAAGCHPDKTIVFGVVERGG